MNRYSLLASRRSACEGSCTLRLGGGGPSQAFDDSIEAMISRMEREADGTNECESSSMGQGRGRWRAYAVRVV